MPSIRASLSSALVVACLAAFYQLLLKDLLTISLGVGRVIQTIDEFPYTCRRLEHPRLEGCEDLWLDDEARALYAGCAGTHSRLNWNPAIGKVNVSARRPGGSELIKLDIDNPGSDGLFNFRAIEVSGYEGATSDNSIDILGFDAQILDDDVVRFYFVNLRPPVDTSRNILDAFKTGANATMEVFEMKRSEERMRHIRTVWSPAVWTPNRIAALDDGSFYVTNDHSVGAGFRQELDILIGGGNIAFCAANGECSKAFDGTEDTEVPSSASSNEQPEGILSKVKELLPRLKMKFPNGLARGRDGLIYVPSTTDGQVRVFSINQDKTLKQIDTIHTGMPLDNISPDAKGDLYVPGFPKVLQTFNVVKNPYSAYSPVTIWRIRKTADAKSGGGGESANYKVEKVIEDRDSKVLSFATTVRHDVKTGRLFIGSVIHPYIAVCDPK